MPILEVVQVVSRVQRTGRGAEEDVGLKYLNNNSGNKVVYVVAFVNFMS